MVEQTLIVIGAGLLGFIVVMLVVFFLVNLKIRRIRKKAAMNDIKIPEKIERSVNEEFEHGKEEKSKEVKREPTVEELKRQLADSERELGRLQSSEDKDSGDGTTSDVDRRTEVQDRDDGSNARDTEKPKRHQKRNKSNRFTPI